MHSYKFVKNKIKPLDLLHLYCKDFCTSTEHHHLLIPAAKMHCMMHIQQHARAAIPTGQNDCHFCTAEPKLSKNTARTHSIVKSAKILLDNSGVLDLCILVSTVPLRKHKKAPYLLKRKEKEKK